MNQTPRFTAAQVMPERAVVLAHQGMAVGQAVSDRIEALYVAGSDLCQKLAGPIGIVKEIDRAQFAEVYRGEGLNESSTPVGDILERSDRLALFAVTLGPGISREISARFEANDLALGCMLDSVASGAADKLAELIERRYYEEVTAAGLVDPGARALRYSPGYCGWHISGQGRLFDYLKPREIGICLRDSFLMDPLKSVSGVILTGPRDIHEFDMEYSCCAECQTHDCRERIRAGSAELAQ